MGRTESKTDWSDVAEWLAIAAVIITIIVVAYLNGQAHRQAKQRLQQEKIQACVAATQPNYDNYVKCVQAVN